MTFCKAIDFIVYNIGGLESDFYWYDLIRLLKEFGNVLYFETPLHQNYRQSFAARLISLDIVPPAVPDSIALNHAMAIALGPHTLMYRSEIEDFALSYLKLKKEVVKDLVLKRCKDLIWRCNSYDRIILSIVFLNL